MAALATAVMMLGLTGVWPVAAGTALLVGAVPLSISNARMERHRSALAEAWPDFLIRLRGSLAGGASLPEAFENAARSSGGELETAGRVVRTARVRGASFPEALTEVGAALADPIADRVLAVLAAAHRSGGPQVGTMLESLGRSVADELQLRQAHDAALTEQRLTALVALVAPWVLLVLTVATNPAAAEAYRTRAGTVVVGTGLMATGIGYLLARRAARLSRPPRVLR